MVYYGLTIKSLSCPNKNVYTPKGVDNQILSFTKMSNVKASTCTVVLILTFTTLWAFSADDKLMIFFLLFSENRIWHFMQIVSLHEISYPVFLKKIRKYFKMSSAENFTQSAKC